MRSGASTELRISDDVWPERRRSGYRSWSAKRARICFRVRGWFKVSCVGSVLSIPALICPEEFRKEYGSDDGVFFATAAEETERCGLIGSTAGSCDRSPERVHGDTLEDFRHSVPLMRKSPGFVAVRDDDRSRHRHQHCQDIVDFRLFQII
jgi:hypothetical protein